MAKISPFKALRPAAGLADAVASRPYDVLNSTEAKEEAAGNLNSFLHITKSEIDLPDDIDSHSMAVYEKAKENLDSFITNQVLFREAKPCYYIYQLIMPALPGTDGKEINQTGIVCGSSVDDYENGIIKKHEFTRPEKEQDRINHIKTTGAQTGNVFLAYRNVESIDVLIDQVKKDNTPTYDITATDGIQHTIWVVNNDDTISQITSIFEEEVPYTYIADGHHRAASAAKVRQQSGADATEGSNIFLTTLFPSNQLQIIDYNRVVKDLNGLSVETLLEKIGQKFDILTNDKTVVKPTQLHQLGMYVDGSWYTLTAKAGTYTEDPIGVLDITILSENILDTLLGIKDQRTDKRIDFVGGIRGMSELEKKVNSGEWAIAFSIYPVSIQQLFDIADSGNVMPPKSTWFEPKLRDGLLTHLIN